MSPARSRLSNPKLRQKVQKSRRTHPQQPDNEKVSERIWKRTAAHRQHLPLLIIASLGYIAVGYIIATYPPAAVADVLLPQAYLPLQLPLLLANFFFFSFMLQNTRRGLLIALLLAILLFLRLQYVVFQIEWLGPVLIFFVIIELIYVIAERKQRPTSHRTRK